MSNQNPLIEINPRKKIETIQSLRAAIFDCVGIWRVPLLPGRDLEILGPEELPPKLGLSFKEGQARLLHDLASIELQAMELGLRSLLEYPEADPRFRDELLQLTLEESRHLSLCLDSIESLGFHWGQWPTHNILWKAVASEDSLLDRLLIVHRYLEGSGLDAGATLLRRLAGVKEGIVHSTVKTIVEEEVAHVNFGSRWYRLLCKSENLDPDDDFDQRFKRLRQKLPKRIEPISIELRKRAGFTEKEIDVLTKHRESMVKYSKRSSE